MQELINLVDISFDQVQDHHVDFRKIYLSCFLSFSIPSFMYFNKRSFFLIPSPVFLFFNKIISSNSYLNKKDSLNHAMNQTSLGERKSYTVQFSTFQKSVNDKIESVTVEAVKSGYSSAKAPNIHVQKGELKEEGTETKTVTKLKKCNPGLYDAIDTLKLGYFDITPNNILKELKKMRKEGSLPCDLYNWARKDLQKIGIVKVKGE